MNRSFPPMPADPLDQAREMFDKAIEAGFLSMNKDKPNYAGNYMFMGISKEERPKAMFKESNLRCYVCFPIELL